MFNLVLVVLCVIYSNAEDESIFSLAKRYLTQQQASLELDETFSSILSFQLERNVICTSRQKRQYQGPKKSH